MVSASLLNNVALFLAIGPFALLAVTGLLRGWLSAAVPAFIIAVFD